MQRPAHRARPASLARGLGLLVAAVLFSVVALTARASARPCAPLPARPGAPRSDWGLEQTTLSDQAIGVERAAEGARTRRADSSGPVLLQNALGIEQAGACALVRTRTRAWQPRPLVRPCVTARAPPRR